MTSRKPPHTSITQLTCRARVFCALVTCPSRSAPGWRTYRLISSTISTTYGVRDPGGRPFVPTTGHCKHSHTHIHRLKLTRREWGQSRRGLQHSAATRRQPTTKRSGGGGDVKTYVSARAEKRDYFFLEERTAAGWWRNENDRAVALLCVVGNAVFFN